jgi:hypothetical protein
MRRILVRLFAVFCHLYFHRKEPRIRQNPPDLISEADKGHGGQNDRHGLPQVEHKQFKEQKNQQETAQLQPGKIERAHPPGIMPQHRQESRNK